MWFALAAFVTALWMAVTGSLHVDTPPLESFFLQVESFQYVMWMLALNRALKVITGNQLLFGQKALLWISAALMLYTIVDLAVPAITSARVIFLLFLLQAILGLLAVEQLYRHADGSRYLKVLCLSLGLLFFFEIMANTHSLIFEGRSTNVIQARAVVVFATSFLVMIGTLVFSRSWLGESPAKLTVSRPTAFYTTSLVVSGLFVTIASLGAHFISLYGGNWGWVAFTLFSFLSIALLVLTLLSRTFRLRLTVLINKHLFQHKYDYRQEWLNFINRLSHPKDNHSVLHTAFTAMASIFQTPGGAIWMRAGGSYAPLYQSGVDEGLELVREPADSEFCQVLKNDRWVFMPRATTREMQKHNRCLPAWVDDIPDAWLMVPLLSGADNELNGFVMLMRPPHNDMPTWEDLDLLKLVGRELANYLKLHEQSRQLAENMQFDAYNKLTAFIMHDLNNVIAQQSLVVSNAAKHKDNPEFIEDAIDTISNSVARMKELLHKLKHSESQQLHVLSLGEVIQGAIENCRSGRPVPVYTTLSSDLYIQADRDRIELAIGHLLKNAQDATSDDGHIDVILNRDDNMAVVVISDNGEGMDESFIANSLFRPFQTTKSGKGMGIGAYLTRSYIQQLGGTLEVASRRGVGTTFTLRLKVIER